MGLSKMRGEEITLATTRGFATVLGIPPGFDTVEVDIPSATLESIQVAFGPRIRRVFIYDASAPAASRWQEVTDKGTDRNTGSVLDLSEMQLADRLYVGTARRCEGISVDMVGTNGAGTADIVGEYPNGLTWTTLSVTDGTKATRTLAQDGLITWTVPTTGGWQARSLGDVAGEATPPPATEQLFWTRFRPSAALTDTSVTIAELTALFSDSLNTLTGETEGQAAIRLVTNNGGIAPYRIALDRDMYGSIELISASITTAANINWLALR